MDKNSKVSFYISFLVWPFGTLLYVFKHFRKPIARPIFVLAVSFLGFTANSEGDLARYENSYYIFQNQSFSSIFSSLFSLNRLDLYVDTVAILTGVFNSHHFHFAVLFGVFGYLLSGVIIKFLELLPQRFTRLSLLFFIGFVLFYSIRSIISVRFYTGGLFYLLMMLNYITTGQKKYIIYSFFTPLFHFGLAILVLGGPLLLILRRKYLPALILVIVSFAIGQSTVIGFLGRQVSDYEGTMIERKYNTYAAEPGRERLEAKYGDRMLVYNWKARSLEYVRDALWYWLILGIGILFYQRKILYNNKLHEDLFMLILILFSFSNLMLNISNGNRYIFLYLLLALGLFLLLYSTIRLPRRLQLYMYILIPLSVTYGLMSLYAANPLFTFKFFIFNYPAAIFMGR